MPILDPDKVKDVGNTSFQIEFEGPCAISSMFCFGRPVLKSENSTRQFIAPPRRLLPLRLETPITSPLNTKPAIETNYFGGLFRLSLTENYRD